MLVGTADLRVHSPYAASVPARRVGCADGLCEAEPVASVFPIKTFPNHYIRVTAFDATQGVESVQMSYIVNRPKNEPGFGLTRQEIGGRQIQYTVHSYATDKPEGERY